MVQVENSGQNYICLETSEGKVVVDVTVFQKYDAKPRMNAAKPGINHAHKYMDTSKISRPKIKKYTRTKHMATNVENDNA